MRYILVFLITLCLVLPAVVNQLEASQNSSGSVATVANASLPMPSQPSIDWTAWVQAIGSVIAILVAVYVANREHKRNLEVWRRSEAKIDAERSLKTRSLALAITHPLKELDLLASRASAKISNEYQELVDNQQLEQIESARLFIPSIFSESVHEFYLLGETGDSVQEAVALAYQHNDILDECIRCAILKKPPLGIEIPKNNIKFLRKKIDDAQQKVKSITESDQNHRK